MVADTCAKAGTGFSDILGLRGQELVSFSHSFSASSFFMPYFS